MTTPIDLWDTETFDDALAQRLTEAADLISNYFDASERQRREREAWDLRGPFPSNDFAGGYLALADELAVCIADRTVRAWHYTRLTEEEVDGMLSFGVQTSTLETTRARLAVQVAAGRMTAETADALMAASPFQGEQHNVRTGRFWMTSSPQTVDDLGVEPLLANWGGEAVSFGLADEALQIELARIGRPRILEIAVPLAATDQTYSASRVIVSTFARTLGRKGEISAIDLCATRALRPEAILAVHSEGETTFEQIGRSYPPRFDQLS